MATPYNHKAIEQKPEENTGRTSCQCKMPIETKYYPA